MAEVRNAIPFPSVHVTPEQGEENILYSTKNLVKKGFTFARGYGSLLMGQVVAVNKDNEFVPFYKMVAAEGAVEIGTAELAFDAGIDNGKYGNFKIAFAKAAATTTAAWSEGVLTLTLNSGDDAITAADLQALIRATTTGAPTGLDVTKIEVTGDNVDGDDVDGNEVTLAGGRGDIAVVAVGILLDNIDTSDSKQLANVAIGGEFLAAGLKEFDSYAMADLGAVEVDLGKVTIVRF